MTQASDLAYQQFMAQQQQPGHSMEPVMQPQGSYAFNPKSTGMTNQPQGDYQQQTGPSGVNTGGYNPFYNQQPRGMSQPGGPMSPGMPGPMAGMGDYLHRRIGGMKPDQSVGTQNGYSPWMQHWQNYADVGKDIGTNLTGENYANQQQTQQSQTQQDQIAGQDFRNQQPTTPYSPMSPPVDQNGAITDGGMFVGGIQDTNYTKPPVREVTIAGVKSYEGDPQGMYEYTKANGIEPEEVDKIMGWPDGTAGKWVATNVGTPKKTAENPTGGDAYYRERYVPKDAGTKLKTMSANDNPDGMLSYASDNGMSAAQVDTQMGWPAGTSQTWLDNNNKTIG